MESNNRKLNNRVHEQVRIEPELKDELMFFIIKYNRKFHDRMTIKRFTDEAIKKYLKEFDL